MLAEPEGEPEAEHIFPAVDEDHITLRQAADGIDRRAEEDRGEWLELKVSGIGRDVHIQTRAIDVLPTITAPEASREIEGGEALDAAARALIERSDTLFVATAYLPEEGESPEFGADASHRGGSPGFVRVEDERTFVFPDFTGNFHFNTVGNIVRNPRAGFLFIDFDSGDLLTVTCTARIIWDSPELTDFKGAQRLVEFRIQEGVFLKILVGPEERREGAAVACGFDKPPDGVGEFGVCVPGI